jgi:hypothetical protein
VRPMRIRYKDRGRPAHHGRHRPQSPPTSPPKSSPRTLPPGAADDEFAGLDHYLRAHALTDVERGRLRQTADLLEREQLIDLLIAATAKWLPTYVDQRVERQVADLLDIPTWELARWIRERRPMR